MTDPFARYSVRVDEHLAAALTLPGAPPALLEVMRYGVFNGGKRVRPNLAYFAAEALGLPLVQVDSSACALEMIHAYSLIHDDLPAMGDDDLRRGKPTCHIRYSEADAILAADALQALAFDIIARDPNLAPEQCSAAIALLARAVGAAGMVGGQVLDLAAENQRIPLAALEEVHLLKTGALIRASLEIPAAIAGASKAEQAALSDFGHHLGLAFQVRDDILDVIGDTERLGKQVGADENRDKSTFVSLCGLNEAQAYLMDRHDNALKALAPLGERAARLRELADFVVEREH